MHVRDEIVVSDETIEYAEKVILPDGMHFDSERRKYLRDFTTLDLKAVPGSGKTTLLLAKLVILEQYLPLRSGRSVLVLSHTNAAVDEINDRLKKHCPKLFSYPNFIGTIQSFVNKFLAVPYFESCSKVKVVSIDADNYNKFVEFKYNVMPRYALASWLKNQREPLALLQSLRLNEDNKLIKHIDGEVEKFPLKDSSGKSYKSLVKFKNSIWKKGILQFDDAYYFAYRYIVRDNSICSILRERFGFVFVDEMQDMAQHQYKILEIFNTPDVCFQRLGDNNQAIYSNIVYENNIWATRANTITIHGSYRLSKKNAQLASRFGMDGVEIAGLNADNSDYKPVMIVFDEDNCECEAIKAFKTYIETHPDNSKISVKSGYKVVAWRKKHEKDHLTLKKYCPKYLYMHENNLSHDADNQNNYKLVMEIYSWLGWVLFYEQAHFNGQIVTRGNIRRVIKDKGLYNDEFKAFIYSILDSYNKEDTEGAIKECENILKLLLSGFGYEKTQISEIINDVSRLPAFLNEDLLEISEEKCSECAIKEIKPVVGTVHSVKGETHDITFFLESYYDGKFESDILEKCISGKASVAELLRAENECIKTLEKEIAEIIESGKDRGIKTRIDKIRKHQTQIGRIQQYSKLVYVALSRARGIIGYGISEKQFEKYFDKEEVQEKWDLVFVRN
ncbi:DNA helicase [Petrocella atlantisensis]|uniref:DNA helicase n=1 Tax=Petrocella atlantisensis TaxID=2173034 RepID=A0A3P7PJX5_9FIRM|nr:UvrD-helicase domain-containing protein [Petrocella atlantisensis]VDN49248.1 DNA helicase [Petrocella atlantisensis]